MQRDSMSFDIVCVGGGVATLATVLRLLKRVKEAGSSGPGQPPSVIVIEKGSCIGAHVLSGAVVDPAPLSELFSKDELANMPVASRVKSETFCRLTSGGAMKLPWIPPMMQAHGFPIVSMSEVAGYLGKLCESAGAEVQAGLSGASLLEENGRITGVRIGDRGIDKTGAQKPNFDPGPDLIGKVVVLGEGACGKLTEKLIADKGLAGSNPQTFAVGIKEVIEAPAVAGRAGSIYHTFGYPLDYWTYGGGFVYCLSDTTIAIGLATALDYSNPTLNPHDLFRQFKMHPFIKGLIAGGKPIGYGAKVLPEGGVHSSPGLVADGVMIVGDGGGLLDSLRLKGVHIAIQSGIAAGDTLFECWKRGDFSAGALSEYPKRMKETAGWKQMTRVRNVRASFRYGALGGVMGAGMSVVTYGVLPPGRLGVEKDSETLKPKSAVTPWAPVAKCGEADRNLQLDRLSDLFFSGTKHEENQPCHLKIINTEVCKECIGKFGAPCTLFCPAQVYSLPEGETKIHVDFSNCLHCKTCQIKDPYKNIEWNLPEAGGGPKYTTM